MQGLFEKIERVREILDQGSTMCPKQQFPLLAFTCGFMFDRIKNTTDLFSLLEVLHYLKAEKKIPQTIYQQILQTVYEKPHLFEEIADLLQKVLSDPNTKVLIQLDKICQKDRKKMEEEPKNLPVFEKGKKSPSKEPNNSIKKNGTGTIEFPDNTIEMENQSEGTQKYDENYFAKIEEINKQSEALARRLQQEEEQLAKKGVVDEEVLCDVCYVGLYDEEFIPLESCQHIFHKNCLLECFKSMINENKFPLKCPNDECQKQLNDGDIKQVLNDEMKKKYEKHTLKFYADMNGDTISWCPTADCQYMFFYEKDDDVRFQCAECRKQYCLNCRVDWHKNMTCKQFQVTNTHSAADDAFMKFVTGKKFKQCPKCKFWVEKNQGCDHMTCKCTFQFCYKCGGVYGKCECVKKHQQDMERRRQQQLARQEKKKARLQKLKQKKEKEKQVEKPTRSRRKR